MTSPYRISALVDNPFEFPSSDAPDRTPEGAPWLRWANVGNYEGWYAIGSRKPSTVYLSRPTFWQKTFCICAAVGNVHMEAVHAIGPGILSLGALGVTMSSHYAPALLHYCLVANPQRYIEVMAEVMRIWGAHPRATTETSSGWAFATSEGEMLSASDLVVYDDQFKDQRRVWVECCSRLLRDDSFDDVQVAFLQDFAPKLLSAQLRHALRWPTNDLPDSWSWTAEQQALWAVVIACAFDDEVTTAQVALQARGAATSKDAVTWLREMRVAASALGVDERFEHRVIGAQRAAQDIFEVQLGVGVA